MTLPAISKGKCGFTLIELLIVIGITLALVVVAIPIYGNLQVSSQLNDSMDQIVQTLRTARERSIARRNDSMHGVYFEINAPGDDRFILYQGDSFATRDSNYDRALTLSSSIMLSTTLSGDEVSFSKSFGGPNATGTVILTHDAQGARTVTITRIGSIFGQ
ncbi:prepilin-type N-terminal cleavage/methylation domain-containing protein [Patescibacteria group bacterium]|nr:prepilin-type N-terminal cleavage/methylation domain-containing protein [Patescibacteria group bacterium]